MRNRDGIVCAAILTLGVAASSGGSRSEPGPAPAAAHAGRYRISGPYVHKNLTAFLIHGQEALKSGSFLTLQEALDQKKAVVHETGSVNELAVENLSPDKKIYIQSGDIVKGGRQDRVIAYDFVVPPRSGRMPIASFCVEEGRWTPRRGEAAGFFASSADLVASKGLKLAARKNADQAEVWSEVREAQAKLSASLGASVRSPRSESSLQLTLEDEKVRETADGYVKALAGLGDRATDVIGYAFAINGRLSGAEVYASRSLFRRLWPKLLKSSAVEAIAELERGKRFAPVSATAVLAWIAEAEKAAAVDKEVGGRVRMTTRETARSILFETLDHQDRDGWLHRSYVAK